MGEIKTTQAHGYLRQPSLLGGADVGAAVSIGQAVKHGHVGGLDQKGRLLFQQEIPDAHNLFEQHHEHLVRNEAKLRLANHPQPSGQSRDKKTKKKRNKGLLTKKREGKFSHPGSVG